MVTVSELRSQISNARQSIVQNRNQAETARSEVERQESQLPQPTQRNLRQGQFSGQQGRIRRVQVGDIKNKLQESKSKIQEFLGEVGQYETDVNTYESDVNQYEQDLTNYNNQVAEYEGKIQQYNYGRKLATQGAPPVGLSEIEREGYNDENARLQFYQQQRDSQQNPSQPTQNFQTLSTIQPSAPSTLNIRNTDTSVSRSYSSGFNLVAAQSKNLTTQGVSNNNGLGSNSIFFSRSTGNVVGDYGGVDNSSLNRDKSGGFISNFVDRFQESKKKARTKEIYSPELNAFVSASETGSAGTPNLRSPTIEESQKIRQAQERGNALITSNTYGEAFKKTFPGLKSESIKTKLREFGGERFQNAADTFKTRVSTGYEKFKRNEAIAELRLRGIPRTEENIQNYRNFQRQYGREVAAPTIQFLSAGVGFSPLGKGISTPNQFIAYRSVYKTNNQGITGSVTNFVTSEGKTGFATGLASEGSSNVVRGTVGYYRYNLLTGKREFVPENIFFGYENTATKVQEPFFAEKGFGKGYTAGKKKADSGTFESYNFGFTNKEGGSFSVGKVSSPTGQDIFNFGISTPLKTKPSKLKQNFEDTSFGKNLNQQFPYDDKLLRQVQEQEKNLNRNVGNIISKAVSKQEKVRSRTINSFGTGAAITESAYAGTGLYERTAGGLFPSQSVKQNVGLENRNRVNTLDILGLKQPQRESSVTKQGFGLKPTQGQPQQFKLLQQKVSKLDSKTFSLLKDFLGKRVAQRSTQKTTQTSRGRIKPTVSSKTVFSSTKAKIVKVGSQFFVYSKRFGEDILIGTFGTLSEAKNFLKSYLENTLRASGKIFEGKSPVLFDLGKNFSRSKRDPFRQVQPRSQRLKKGDSQVKEIQYFKTLKGGKKKFSIW